ncbi:LOW QUALITY PROTEIN: 17-beta-hydroxysteroid dehydrogenase 14 [Rhineura floridana]|uniref:LOW QUALITY PROTEIN: 17-beta-hydroxysteroid dehydrogenase 14 n=1 Tax=Rhineura floridana TaxID=261503 RepID=UPI002AC804B4|nr:LOW QUALITY PROTEIN: 17-beta-hydroxysteroid dehydrogenase 14 [Rhineura floridana]
MPRDREHAQWEKPHVAASLRPKVRWMFVTGKNCDHIWNGSWATVPGQGRHSNGRTRGIGEGIVREFVLHGAKVVFCAPGSEEERGKALQRELKDSGGPGEGHFEVCDVRCETDIKMLVSVTVELYGRLDCLVNNAGGHPPDQIIDDVTAQEFRSLMDLNVVSCFLTAKFALPHLRKTKGNIINIASLVNVIGQKYAVPYVATKGAVTAMTKAMAIDESKYGVRVNSISPGNIWTPMWEKLASHTANPEATIQEGKDAQLLGRMGTPAECAAAALYLSSDATFCTGINLVLSGGAELGYAQKSHRNSSSDFEG